MKEISVNDYAGKIIDYLCQDADLLKDMGNMEGYRAIDKAVGDILKFNIQVLPKKEKK